MRSPAPGGLIALTPAKVQLLRYLAELRFLSLPQLARLCCPSERQDLSERSARRHLRALFDAGLVDVLPVSRAALAPPDAPNDASLLYGSAPNVYTPTARGLETLVKVGLIGAEDAKRPAPSYGPRNSLFLAHELAVRDVRVWLEGCARTHGGDHQVLEWRDGEAAAIRLGRATAPSCVRPDAWFVYRLRGGEKPVVLVGLVEVDRGTERGNRRWQEKMGAYAALFADGHLLEGTGYKNARVLVITPDAHRRDLLAELIQTSVCPVLAQRFWLAFRGHLDSWDVTQPLWRRPDSQALLSLVPAHLLGR